MMSKTERARIAAETVAILQSGSYTGPQGDVSIAEAVAACVAGTRLFTPNELAALRDTVLTTPPAHTETRLEVAAETTLAGARHLLRDGGPVVALNFASAKNPGGGFRSGAEAQEESLARASALSASLESPAATPYYTHHRGEPSLLYSDRAILSPACPVIRDDDGLLLQEPYLVTFVTCPAPNAGAILQNKPGDLPRVEPTLRRRAELVLALAAAHGGPNLVLGAWGCGVFRNDPTQVAEAFGQPLRPGGSWFGRFRRVRFSVYDRLRGQPVLTAFQTMLLQPGYEPQCLE